MDYLIQSAEKETNRKKRIELYKKIHKRLLDRLAVLPLWYEEHMAAMRQNIIGYTLSYDGNYDSLIAVKKLNASQLAKHRRNLLKNKPNGATRKSGDQQQETMDEKLKEFKTKVGPVLNQELKDERAKNKKKRRRRKLKPKSAEPVMPVLPDSDNTLPPATPRSSGSGDVPVQPEMKQKPKTKKRRFRKPARSLDSPAPADQSTSTPDVPRQTPKAPAAGTTSNGNSKATTVTPGNTGDDSDSKTPTPGAQP